MTTELHPQKITNVTENYLSNLSGIKFTKRQIDILACLINNRNYSKIAELLSIPSVRTVHAHVRNIKEKLGKSSIEHIVDFIDSSGTREYFYNHYLYLLVEADFSKTLKNISVIIGKHKQRINSNSDNKDIFYKIIDHLKLANIEVERIISASHGEKNFNIHTIDNNYLEFNLDSHKSIYILIENDIDDSTLEETNYIDFRETANYYFAVLQLIARINNNYRIKREIESFKERYNKLINSWKKLTSGIVVDNKAIDLENKIEKYSKYLIFITIIFAVILVLTIYFNNFNKKLLQYKYAEIQEDIADNNYKNQDFYNAIKTYKLSEKSYFQVNNLVKQSMLLSKIGWSYIKLSNYKLAEENFNKAIKLLDNSDQSENKGNILSGMAIIYDKTNRNSIALHKEAYKIYQYNYGVQDHSNLADVLHNIGWYYREVTKDIVTSINYFNESYEMRKRLYLNKYHPDIATSINSLGTTYVMLGGDSNIQKGLQFQHKSLAIREENAKDQLNQDLINSYFRLGETYSILKEDDKSLYFLEKAKSTMYDYAKTYNYRPLIGIYQIIGNIYEKQEYYNEAIECYKKAYSIIKQYEHNIDYNSDNKKLVEKLKLYDNDFLTNSELRSHIINRYDSFVYKNTFYIQKKYQVKKKLSTLLLKLQKCSGSSRCNFTVDNTIINSILQKSQYQDNITDLDLEIAKSLCFESINIGIMSTTADKRNYEYFLEFAKRNRELLKKMAKFYPEYFVDLSLIRKAIDYKIITIEDYTRSVELLDNI